MSALVAAEPPPQQQHYQPRFPLFRARFCAASNWYTPDRMNQENDPTTSASSPTASQRPALRRLDLKSLPVEDSTLSETQQRRQKYLYFEKHCSEISPGLFLSGDYVAKNRETLRQAGVTHVLNCVGFICKEYFKEELTYKTLYLQDTPAEDISCVLYDCLDYIDAALSAGGRVLVHCSQGVSRSATLVIAYMMWRSGKPYDEAFAAVKAIRGVANPNIGFTCQLLQWQKRAATARTRMRMYRIAPHCVHAPAYLVPKLITPPKQYPNNTHRDLDPRGAFVLQTPAGGPTYVWRGEACPEAYAEAAHRAAAQLQKFEGAGPVVEVRQGQEPLPLVALLDPAPLDAEAARINAKRSSITGEIELSGARGDPLLGGTGSQPLSSAASQQQQQQGMTTASTSNDMDVDPPPSCRGAASQQPQQPSLYPPQQMEGTGGGGGAGSSGGPGGGGGGGGLIALDLSNGGGIGSQGSRPRSGSNVPREFSTTPRPRSAGGSGGGPGPLVDGSQMLLGPEESGHCLAEPVVRWVPQEVEEYTDDYMLYQHSVQQSKAAGSSGGPFDGPMRVSYDTAGGITTSGGMVVAAPAGVGPQTAEVLFGGPTVRPDSPATKEGRHKKYRRADSERPKLGYWTAACSDGIGPELARTHNVSSLHESVDEDVLGLPPPGLPGQ